MPAGADIVLDLNGHTINRGLTTYTQLGSVLCVDGGKLTIEDGAGGGTITGGFTAEYNNWHSDELAYDYGGGIIMKSGELTLNGGSVTGNRADCAGGICVADGKFTMNGGSVTNNIADRTGGGIEIDNDGGHEINGGEISYNTGKNSVDTNGGGGLMLYAGSSLTMNGGIITHNTTKANGGGVFVYAKATFTFNDGEISYNEAAKYEGGISMSTPSTVELNGGIITGNTQTEGTAVCPAGTSTVKVGGPVKIYNNYTNGAQGNLQIAAVRQLQVTGPLITDKGTAFIGISQKI